MTTLKFTVRGGFLSLRTYLKTTVCPHPPVNTACNCWCDHHDVATCRIRRTDLRADREASAEQSELVTSL